MELFPLYLALKDWLQFSTGNLRSPPARDILSSIHHFLGVATPLQLTLCRPLSCNFEALAFVKFGASFSWPFPFVKFSCLNKKREGGKNRGNYPTPPSPLDNSGFYIYIYILFTLFFFSNCIAKTIKMPKYLTSIQASLKHKLTMVHFALSFGPFVLVQSS